MIKVKKLPFNIPDSDPNVCAGCRKPIHEWEEAVPLAAKDNRGVNYWVHWKDYECWDKLVDTLRAEEIIETIVDS